MTLKMFQKKTAQILLCLCVTPLLFLPHQIQAQNLPAFTFNYSNDGREKGIENRAFADQMVFNAQQLGGPGSTDLAIQVHAQPVLFTGSPLGVTRSGEVIFFDHGSFYPAIYFCDKSLEQKYQGLKCADSIPNMTYTKIRQHMSEAIIRMAIEVGQGRGVSGGFLIKKENIMLPVYQ